jgi:hypothetical protein
MRGLRFGMVGLALLLGCAHRVTLERPTAVAAPAPLLPARIDIPPDTATAVHRVTSAMAGGANRWEIGVGDAITAYADAYLPAAFPPGGDATVRIDLVRFDVHDFEAHVDMRFAVLRPDGTLFQQTYGCAGKGYAARVVWGGAFAMQSSMRRTTDEALRQCFEHFLDDARRVAPEWSRPAAAPAL